MPKTKLGLALVGLAIALLAGCAGSGTPALKTASNFAPQRPATFGGLPLTSGQIILSEAPSALNLVIALLPPTYHPFVHAGILDVDTDGTVYVYEAIGAWGVMLGRRPTDAISGTVQRAPLSDFLRYNDYAEVYDPPAGVDRARLAAFARQHYAARTPFDPFFNAYDHRRLYCAEFVALGIESSGGAAVPLTEARPNHSLDVTLDWLGIRAQRHYQAASLVAGLSPVAALSTERTPTEARLHFAVRREIHRRYTANQRLGHVLTWNGFTLGVRDELERFEKAAQRLYKAGGAAPTQSQADFRVRELADRWFGPLAQGGITPPSIEQLRPRGMSNTPDD